VKNGSNAWAITDAASSVRHRYHYIVARLHVVVEAGISLVEMRVGRLDRQPAALGHGVAGVDHEIQDHALELVGIGQCRPKIGFQHRIERQPGATTNTK